MTFELTSAFLEELAACDDEPGAVVDLLQLDPSHFESQTLEHLSDNERQTWLSLRDAAISRAKQRGEVHGPSPTPPRLLVCGAHDPLFSDPDSPIRRSYDVTTTDLGRALPLIERDSFAAIVMDLDRDRPLVFAALSHLAAAGYSGSAIVISASLAVADVLRVFECGVADFLLRPLNLTSLNDALRVATTAAHSDSPERASKSDPFEWRDRVAPWLIGEDAANRPVLQLVSAVASTDCSVLITGEPGTGKELVAKALHAGSSRANKPFVAVDCAAIPSHLVESELFGPGKTAFNQAAASATGRFAQAEGGTIFLGAIDELDLTVQAKLLGLIQDGELVAGGDGRPTKIDVRILAASSRHLAEEVSRGRFLIDLYCHLNVVPIAMPALRDRPTDIARLAEYFVQKSSSRHHREVAGFESEALAKLNAYDWPHNIAELEGVVETAVIMRGRGTIRVADLPPAVVFPRSLALESGPNLNVPKDGTDLRAMLDAVEDRMIEEALARVGRNKNRAAELLGLNRAALVERLRRSRRSGSG